MILSQLISLCGVADWQIFTNFAITKKIITKNNSLWEERLSIAKQEK